MTEAVCDGMTSSARGRHYHPAGGRSPIRPAQIALLTAGRDKPYALGLASALLSVDISLEFIGSTIVDGPELHGNPLVRFLNFRDQRQDATRAAKVLRVMAYYWRLIRYAARAQPRLFHILWNNKVEFFDRTLLMLYYKLCGKKIVLTAHNVNAGKRDSNDSWLNRFSLKTQYKLTDHIFVHTEKMKNELITEFSVPQSKASVIPFGINNTVANTDLSSSEAKKRVDISSSEKTMLFFGNIAPYKGLEYLIEAFTELCNVDKTYRLIIAGQPKGSRSYWENLERTIVASACRHQITEKIEYVPDEETELYFKAADVLVLPYAKIFQSGVLFLGYSFGLPVVAADVGSLKEDIVEGRTGFVFRQRDSLDLARVIRRYFESALFRELESRRAEIKDYANERYSWSMVAAITTAIYSNLLASR